MNDRAPRGITFEQLLAGLAFALVAGAALMMPAGPDTYWSLRAGQDFWRTGHVPLTETYSYTAAGRPWPNHEWLWQALAYALFRAGGMPLLLLASAAVVVAAFALAHRLARGRSHRPMIRFALAALTIGLASFMWVVRPQLVTFLLLLVLVSAVAAERYPVLPPLFVLWANVHGAVALGGVALGGIAGGAVLRALIPSAAVVDRRRALRLLALLPVCALATLVTPLGFTMWRSIAASVGASHHTGIMEWQPIRLDDPYGLSVLALAIAFVVLIVARRRRFAAAPWSDWAVTAAALALLPPALYAVRNVAPFMLVAFPAATRLLARSSEPLPTPKRPANLVLLAAVAAAELAGLVFLWTRAPDQFGWRPISAGALAAVRACPGEIYNHFNDGGFLLWFAPERRVFVDAREDPYPLPLLMEHLAIERGAPYRPLFARYGIRCAFLRSDDRLLPRLRADGWHDDYTDPQWTVLVHP